MCYDYVKLLIEHTTRAAVQTGKMMDIVVQDHLVIGRGRYVSLKERGLGFS